MSRSDDTIKTGCGLVIWLALLYYIGKGYSYLLHKEYFNFKENWVFWVLIYPLTLLILVLFIYSVFRLIKFSNSKYSAYKKKKIRCKHGIEGGETLNLCSNCNYEKEQIIIDKNNRLKQEQYYNELAIKAKQLKKEELKKLAEHRLKNKDYLIKLSPRDFEDVIAELYRKLGYTVTQTPYSNDKGKDAIALKNNKKYVIECKHYAVGKGIGRPQLQKFFAAMMEEKAERGFFITTSHFSNTALEYANKFNIECIDMKALIELFIKAYGEDVNIEIKSMCELCGDIVIFSYSNLEEKKKCSNGHVVFLDSDFVKVPIQYLGSDKICEKCGKKMKLIKGRYGIFWGCSDYPKCRNTDLFKKYNN